MKLIWLDLETTGLDPHTESILEVYAMEADLLNPFEAKEIYHGIAYFGAAQHVKLDPFVRDMHTKSGLLVDCLYSNDWIGSMEIALLQRIAESSDRENMPTLAGSTVHFDLNFLRVHMPRLAKRFSHRVYDVSAVKLFLRSLGIAKELLGPKAEAHRAKDDVLESIDHARLCARHVDRVMTVDPSGVFVGGFSVASRPPVKTYHRKCGPACPPYCNGVTESY